MSARTVPWSEIIGDVECCISRVQALCLMSEALLKLDRRSGDAFAIATDDLEDHLVGIRDRLHANILDGRAAS